MSPTEFNEWLTAHGYNTPQFALGLQLHGHPGSISEINKMVSCWRRGVLGIPPGIVVAINLLGRMRSAGII